MAVVNEAYNWAENEGVGPMGGERFYKRVNPEWLKSVQNPRQMGKTTAIKQLIKENNMCSDNNANLRAARKLDADHLELYKADIIDADGDLTEDGRNLLLDTLLEANMAALVAIAKKAPKE